MGDGGWGAGVASDGMQTQGATRTDEMGRTALRWRALTTDDVAAWAELLAAAEAVDVTGEHYDADDLIEELADPLLDAAHDTVGAFDDNGVMVAYGLVRSVSKIRDHDQYDAEGCVHPDHRRRGLGRAVVERVTERAAQLHRQRHPELEGRVYLRVHDGNTHAVALARQAGMEPVRYWYDMARDLTDLPEPAPLADGLLVVGYDPELDDAVRLARNEAFADHWGSVERTMSDWRQWFTGSRSFRPAISLLALDGDEVAGFLLSYEYEADIAASGVSQTWIGQIGTRRAWRGRGVASALLTRALAAYAAAGYQRTALGVDTGNPTGALGLYERAGFAPTERWTSFARPL